MAKLSFSLGDLLETRHISELLEGTGLALGFASAQGATFAQVWEGLSEEERTRAYTGLVFAAGALKQIDEFTTVGNIEGMVEAMRAERIAGAQEEVALARAALSRAEAALSVFTIEEGAGDAE